jgi:flagellar L-ring protein precursor FlgH
MGADNLTNGNPGVRLQWQNKYETEGQADREDKFVTRVTGQIIDVKPNGNVVVEARKYEKHDDEEITVTLTGVCRAKDITPDNTVLSTQIHDLVITESHTGAVRDATRRGWIPRLLDLLRPF